MLSFAASKSPALQEASTGHVASFASGRVWVLCWGDAAAGFAGAASRLAWAGRCGLSVLCCLAGTAMSVVTGIAAVHTQSGPGVLCSGVAAQSAAEDFACCTVGCFCSGACCCTGASTSSDFDVSLLPVRYCTVGTICKTWHCKPACEELPLDRCFCHHLANSRRLGVPVIHA